MSTLIDSYSKDTQQYPEGWYCAKPLQPTGLLGLKLRIIGAMEVLFGLAIAVHFREDENK